MADKAVARNTDDAVSTEKKLDELYELIDGIEVAMLTTRRADGHLVSRPMQTQERETGLDLWFMTNVETHKLDDLMTDPHVNLAYYKDRTREWISVSGVAHLSRDRAKIRELYAPDWAAWFPKEGDPRDGTPEDPRMVLIGVDIHGAEFLEVNTPQPVVLFELVKGWLTGSTPEIGEMHRVRD